MQKLGPANVYTYDDIRDGCADGHDCVGAAGGPKRAARWIELVRELLKGERRFEHDRYKAEHERRSRDDEHKEARDRAHAIVATFGGGGMLVRRFIRSCKRNVSQEYV